MAVVKMTRHARNCTAGAVYTYHERKRDTAASGYGSQAMRVGKDSVKEFDCCCLTLQPCKNPVLTPDGYLYDKEAVLKYILHQKKEIARKLKEFEKQKAAKDKDVLDATAAQLEAKKKSFLAAETKIVSKQLHSFTSKPTAEASTSNGATASVSNMQSGLDKALPSFWLPSLTPQAKKTEVNKPDEKVRCPMSNKPLKMKDLIDIEFTAIKDGDEKKSLITKDARFVCALTNDVLGNSVPCAALRTSGKVVTCEAVEKLIRKDMKDPFNGRTLREKDIITLERGSSGFAGAGITLKAKVHGPALMS